MAATPGKQEVELDDSVKFGFWDSHHDFSTHVRNKNMNLQSRNDKFTYFTNLSQGFHVHNPLADPDVVNFVSDLYDSVKCQLLDPFDDNVEYEIFLDHLRFDGKSYVLDIPEEGILVKYEQEEPKDYTLPPATYSEPNTSDWTDPISVDTNLNSQAEELRQPPGKKRQQPLQTNVGAKRRGRKPKQPISANTVPKAEKRRGRKPKQPVSVNTVPKVEKRRGRKPKQPVSINTSIQSNEGSKVKEEEEDYDDHLPDLKRRPQRQEPEVNVDEWWQQHEANIQKRTEFREKLMETLKKPYCEEEYQMLHGQLKERKPVQNHRELRRCTKSYEEKRLGKSFLDHHTDLEKRIDSVRDDHPKVLNLLRGFFYWIKNLSREGSFLPWEDPSCLEVLPL